MPTCLKAGTHEEKYFCLNCYVLSAQCIYIVHFMLCVHFVRKLANTIACHEAKLKSIL